MKKIFCFMMMICLFVSLVTNCSDDKDEPIDEIPTSLTVDKTSFSVDALASTESFAVSSNKDWTAKTEVSWLTLSPTSGKADSKLNVEISISANPDTDSRSAVIIITADDRKMEVKVEQQGKVILPGIEIADEKFKQYLVEHFDIDDDGEISTGEAEAVTVMDCSGKEISSLAGIEYFVNLDTLNCNSNLLTKLDVSRNVNLTMLNCDSNKIDSLGISKNIALKVLSCSLNELTELNVSSNVNLTDLDCGSNKLAGLDVSKNVSLLTLTCSDNELAALDLDSNVALTTLICTDNKLTSLDVSKNLSLKKLDCRNNELLKTISLAEGQAIADLLYDEDTTELEYPEEEKEIVPIPDENFKAYLVENFDTDNDGEISETEALVIKDIRCSRMEIASLSGIAYFTNLEILLCNENKLSSVDVSKNLQLKTLECGGNEIGSINVSKNTELERLRCYSNGLSALNVKNNTKLLFLNCNDNKIKELDLSDNVLLENLYCQTNNLLSLDLRNNIKLSVLGCNNNPKLETLYLEEGHTIPELYIDTPPTSIVYPNYVKITDEAFLAYLISEFDSDNDGKLSEAESKTIKEIDCSNLEISSLEGVGLFTNLVSLICSGNNLTSIDISSNTKLVTFVCDSNKISSLDLSNNESLVVVNCAKNQLASLNVSANKELITLICNDNGLRGLNTEYNAKLETLLCQNNSLPLIMDMSKNMSLKTFDCRNNPKLARLYLKADQKIETLLKDDSAVIKYVGEGELPISFADEKFKAYLIRHFDKDGDGEIIQAEALSIANIDCSNLGIESLSGIEYLTNLTSLICDGNELTSLPIQRNIKLGLLYCSDNSLSSIDLTGLVGLKHLICRRNQIGELNLTKNINLISLDCQSNELVALSVRYNPLLETLICFDNPNLRYLYMTTTQAGTVSVNKDGTTEIKEPENAIVFKDAVFENYLLSLYDTDGDGGISIVEAAAITNMDCRSRGISSLDDVHGVNHFVNLSILNCSDNNLTSLNDLRRSTALTVLYCHDNSLTSINVMDCTLLEQFYCPGNLFTELNVEANTSLLMLDCTDNPRLTTVYMDEDHHNEGLVRKDTHTSLVFQ